MFYFRSQKIKSLVAVFVLIGVMSTLFFGFFGFAKPAQAGMGGWVSALVTVAAVGTAAYGTAEAISKIEEIANNFDVICIGLLSGLAKFLGTIFTWVVGMLIQVASYNDFLNSTAVVTGWVIVRDVCNMFFVLILLIISIATVLRVESYSYKKLLPKLLLMAVLINFSKTICGIIIDFAQVVMLTFVNAFKAAAGANFWQAMGINKLFSFDNLVSMAKAQAGNDWNLVGTALLGVIVVLIATITVGVLLIVIVARIAILWTLIVLSPLAYLLASFPQGQQYAKQWWDEFSKNVITGPVLAFFIWLALIIAGGGTAYSQVGVNFTPADLPPGFGDIADPNFLSSFVVAVTLLLVGLMFTQKSGVVGAGVAGSALSGLRRAGTAPARWAWGGVRKTGNLAWRGTKAVAKGGYQRGADILYGATGVAIPGSKMRSELKEERKKTLHRDRLYSGQVASADRISGKRLGIQMAFSALLDPGLARKMGTLDMIKMLPKAAKAETAMQKEADLRKQRARYEKLREDPVGRFETDTKSELTTEKTLMDTAKSDADKYSKEADRLEGELGTQQSADLNNVVTLNAQRVDLESEIAGYDSDITERSREEKEAGDEATSLAERIAEIKTSIQGTAAGTPERATLEAEQGRLETRHREAADKRDQATESKKEKERVKTEAQNNLNGVKQQLAGIKVDVRMERVLDVRAKVTEAQKKSAEHQAKADKLNDLMKRWTNMDDRARAEEAKKRLDKLFKTQSITNSALSALTPELQATMNRALERTKDVLRRRFGGREPTQEEVNRELSAMTA